MDRLCREGGVPRCVQRAPRSSASNSVVLGTTRLFVLPSTSPANAAVPWDERLRWFEALRDVMM